MKAKILATLVLFSALFISDSRCAYGCDCNGQSFPTARRNAKAVFSGTVTDIQDEGVRILVTFKVSRIWKGDKDAKRIVTTNFNTMTCSFYDFSLNGEYLVFANSNKDTLSVGACSRTALLSNAGGDVKELGAGEPPDR